MPSGPKQDLARKHLFILLCDPVTQEQKVLLATISSVKPDREYDDTCILEAGDHRFIKKKSYVVYALCRILTQEQLENGVRQGVFVPRDPIDDALLARILDGLMQSPYTPPMIKDFYTTHVI